MSAGGHANIPALRDEIQTNRRMSSKRPNSCNGRTTRILLIIQKLVVSQKELSDEHKKEQQQRWFKSGFPEERWDYAMECYFDVRRPNGRRQDSI